MDGKGNINVNAPKNMTFSAGENITISAGQNIMTTAGENLTEVAGVNIVQSATADYSLMATNIMEIASEGRTSNAQNIKEQALGIEMQSTKEDVNVLAKNVANTKSGEYGTGH